MKVFYLDSSWFKPENYKDSILQIKDSIVFVSTNSYIRERLKEEGLSYSLTIPELSSGSKENI